MFSLCCCIANLIFQQKTYNTASSLWISNECTSDIIASYKNAYIHLNKKNVV